MIHGRIRFFGTRPEPPFSVSTATGIAPARREYEGPALAIELRLLGAAQFSPTFSLQIAGVPRIAPFTVALSTWAGGDKWRLVSSAGWDERDLLGQASCVRQSFVILLGRKLPIPLAMRQSILPTLALASLAASEYVWPSVYDEIEDHLSLQSGYLRRGFIDG